MEAKIAKKQRFRVVQRLQTCTGGQRDGGQPSRNGSSPAIRRRRLSEGASPARGCILGCSKGHAWGACPAYVGSARSAWWNGRHVGDAPLRHVGAQRPCRRGVSLTCPNPYQTARPAALSTPMFHPFDIPQMAGHTSASSLLAKRSLTTNSR